MRFLIRKFQSIFYIILITTHQINDLHYKYLHLNSTHSDPESESLTENNNRNDTIRNFLNLCYHKIDLNFMPCSISIVPCGDFKDWKSLDSPVTLLRNDSYLSIDSSSYEKLVHLRKELTDNLNQVNSYLRKSNIINIVQEKKLGRTGNSYYYQKLIKKLDIPDAYVSFEAPSKYKYIQTSITQSNCDFLDLTVFDSTKNFMIHKKITKEYFEAIKKEYPKLFSQKFQRPKLKHFKPYNDSCYLFLEHPVLSIIKNITPKRKYTRTIPVMFTDNSKQNKTFKLIQYEDVKFHYRYNQDKIKEINHIFKTYMALASTKEDILLNYAIIQEKTTGEIYMHIRTKSGVNFLNHLVSMPNLMNTFVFKFKKTNSLTLRLKSLESWNILRYEINVPNPNCSNSNDQNVYHTYPGSENLNCDNFDEKLFFEDLNQRESNNKYKEFYAIISYENRVIHNYDQYKCILIEYFGKILTCDGKVVTIEEYGYLRSKNLNFVGLIVLNHGKIRIVRIDNSGNILEFKDAINTRPQQSSQNGMSFFDPQVCHECAKFDLRSQVESSQIYNQYKKAIRIQSEGSEKYVILFLIFIVLSMFWFKQQHRKRKNRA